MPENSNNKQILVLWQGAKGNEYADVALLYLRKQKHILIEHKVSDEGGTITTTVYNNFIEYVNKCDYAIAILAQDERPASKAGNLWFEIGYWLAIKPKGTLLLLKEGSDDETTIISNLAGHIYERFNDKSTLETKISNSLLKLFTKPSSIATDNIHLFKIQETLLDSQPNVDAKDFLGKCGVGEDCNEECSYKKELLTFIAELLRISKSNWEHYIVHRRLLNILSKIEHLLNIHYSIKGTSITFYKYLDI